MKTEIKTITPEWATKVLDELAKRQADGKFRQRPPRERAIQRYAADMVAGKWLVTHQGIAFDDEDNLIDGQNRLWGVVKAGVPVKMAVTTGVPHNGELTAMDVIDCGMSRGLANQLQISHGFGSEAAEAGILVNAVAQMLRASSLWVDKGKRTPQVSVQQALFALHECGLHGAIERMRVLVPTKKMRPRALVCVWCWYWMAHPRKAEEFAHAYVELENLPPKSPVLAVSRYFQLLTQRARKADIRLIQAAAQGFQYFHEGMPLQQLTYGQAAVEWLAGLGGGKLARLLIGRLKA